MGVPDPTKTHLWDGADVFYAPYPLETGVEIPEDIDTPFSAQWRQCGVLDGSFGFQHARSQDKNDFYGWGGILLRTARSKFKLTAKFRLLEDNVDTRALVWPGSTATSLVIPKPARVVLGLETRDDATGKKRRVISSLYSEVELDADITESEEDITGYEMLATIFPTGLGQLWTLQESID